MCLVYDPHYNEGDGGSRPPNVTMSTTLPLFEEPGARTEAQASAKAVEPGG